jgi:hypothetical protein
MNKIPSGFLSSPQIRSKSAVSVLESASRGVIDVKSRTTKQSKVFGALLINRDQVIPLLLE